MASEPREFLLYFPLRNPVEKLEVGVPADASLEPLAPRPQRPLVYYGTSIVHGADASHPNDLGFMRMANAL